MTIDTCTDETADSVIGIIWTALLFLIAYILCRKQRFNLAEHIFLLPISFTIFWQMRFALRLMAGRYVWGQSICEVMLKLPSDMAFDPPLIIYLWFVTYLLCCIWIFKVWGNALMWLMGSVLLKR
ncbi:hypothetical protein WJT86_00800 [Microvirga sp. W0021]|uniref:Uncharacterized protein n=1 Tax=Hohaiivirga grylli TaxID=3133970 RepID=A0ABV0BF44_9HYPH